MDFNHGKSYNSFAVRRISPCEVEQFIGQWDQSWVNSPHYIQAIIYIDVLL